MTVGGCPVAIGTMLLVDGRDGTLMARAMSDEVGMAVAAAIGTSGVSVSGGGGRDVPIARVCCSSISVERTVMIEFASDGDVHEDGDTH